MVICEYGNVKPLLCITKIDLEKSPGLPMYDGSNMPIVEVSNKTKEGIEKLKELLKGKACVFLGSSGVGKSSLINTMFGKEILEVGEISRKSGMGMHTTSSASLHLFKGDTVLIDTPGIRSLSLGNIDENSLKTYFHEFEEYAPQCEFSDCTHSHEPKCAVKEAVENGKIPKWRYDTYIRILDDIRREKK
jgi:ribosome biogenesis GTPase